MTKHFQREVVWLKDTLLELCGLVEKNLALAAQAVSEGNRDIAAQVIESDAAIDQAEVDLEEECLKVLALYQPVAVDLRMIVAVLKINADLERIGDMAVNIAERSLDLARGAGIPEGIDFSVQAARVRAMLCASVDAFVDLDVDKAYHLCASDDAVDDEHRRVFETVLARLSDCAGDAGALLSTLSISRNLERVADHATNIAEDVVYLTTGSIVRHQGQDMGVGEPDGGSAADAAS